MENGSMSAFKKSDDFNQRLSTAAKARQASLEKFRARPRADDPAVAEQRVARLATSQARDARKAARTAETTRLQAEAIRQAADEVERKSTEEASRRLRKSRCKPSARPPAMPVTPHARRGSGNRRRTAVPTIVVAIPRVH
jgi:hypothetical protein